MSTSPDQPTVQTYLFFNGTCEQAVEFYRRALGAEVQMPLGRTFWSPRFGMLTDRFGVGWMVSVATPGQP